MSEPKPVRCAIYTRKSSEEGLQQAFNSLQAQREACEAYVRSQAGEGWVLVTEHYDDGGHERPTHPAPEDVAVVVPCRRPCRAMEVQALRYGI